MALNKKNDKNKLLRLNFRNLTSRVSRGLNYKQVRINRPKFVLGSFLKNAYVAEKERAHKNTCVASLPDVAFINHK